VARVVIVGHPEEGTSTVRAVGGLGVSQRSAYGHAVRWLAFGHSPNLCPRAALLGSILRPLAGQLTCPKSGTT